MLSSCSLYEGGASSDGHYLLGENGENKRRDLSVARFFPFFKTSQDMFLYAISTLNEFWLLIPSLNWKISKMLLDLVQAKQIKTSSLVQYDGSCFQNQPKTPYL